MEHAFLNKRVLIAFSEPSARDKAASAARALGMEVAGCAATFEEALSFLTQMQCDFIFASVLLPLLPTGGLEAGISALSLFKRPAVLYFAPENAGEMMMNAYEPTVSVSSGAEEIKSALEKIDPLCVKDEEVKRALEILSRMGFSDQPARNYLAFASALVLNDQSAARSLKRRVYPALSGAFHKKESSLADAMRRLIDKTFLSGDIENLYRLFGNTIDETRGKPTVSQLIALVGETMRMEKHR